MRSLAKLILCVWFVLATPLAAAQTSLSKLIESAQSQIGVTLVYDGSYQKLDYPNGDVPEIGGVCTDVVIRAYRSIGIDLQLLVHEDMRENFERYPKLWGLKAPDRNIDHRRVPNLQAYLQRHGKTLAPSRTQHDYKAGDLVTWMLPGNLPHIGIVSSTPNATNTALLIIHNIGAGTQKEDTLFMYPITGHYRFDSESSNL